MNFVVPAKVKEAVSELEKYGIQRGDICIVGSCVLEFYSLRAANDIDLVLKTEKYQVLRAKVDPQYISPTGKINLGNGIQILPRRYREIGIKNDQLFLKANQGKLTVKLENLLVAKPELEFGKKLFRNRAKDRDDIILLQRYARLSGDWRWNLIPEVIAPSKEQRTAVRSIRYRAKKVLVRLRDPIGSCKIVLDRKLSYSFKKLTKEDLLPSDLCFQSVDIGTFLQWQFSDGKFIRYDTLLRLHTAEKYIQKMEKFSNYKLIDLNDGIFDDYNRMQSLRCGYSIQTHLRFQELIHSVQQKGLYTDCYPITLAQDGKFNDGSHRLACALAWGVETIPVKFTAQKRGTNDYGRAWFEARNFSDELLNDLDQRLLDILLSTGSTFIMIVWPPAKQFSEEIKSIVSKRFPIVWKAESIKPENIEGLIEKIYFNDDAQDWKIQKRIFNMTKYSPEISVFAFLLQDQRYKLNQKSRALFSETAKSFQAEIEHKYKDKFEVSAHDSLIFCSGNPSTSRSILKALQNHK